MYNLNDIYNKLYDHYGDPHWWPGETPYEIMVGAVLTQNCAWSNVEKAIANLKAAIALTPENLLSLTAENLSELIRPAGFFTRKSLYLRALTEWYRKYDFSVAKVRAAGGIEPECEAVIKNPIANVGATGEPVPENIAAVKNPIANVGATGEPVPESIAAAKNTAKLRAELLAVRGIGKETADSILLYAFGMKTFVIDAYTARLAKRIPLPAGDNYGERQRFFTEHFYTENGAEAVRDYNNFHALIVINAKEHCKSSPKCNHCPLSDECQRIVN